jgi:hypothetical protein
MGEEQDILEPIISESGYHYLQQPKGPPSYEYQNGLLAFANHERVMRGQQEGLAMKFAKKNLPPATYSGVLQGNVANISYWERIHNFLDALNHEADAFLQNNVINACIHRLTECQNEINGLEVDDEWIAVMDAQMKLITDYMIKAQDLQEAIGTIACCTPVHRRILYGHNMREARPFFSQQISRLSEFEANLQNLWIACSVKKRVIETMIS